MSSWLYHVSGGPDYVQIFELVDWCGPMDIFNMGSDRTRLLGDHLTSTCMPISENTQKSKNFLKVLPGRDYLFKRHFSVHIAGKGISCSPDGGINVFIQPWCADQANCTKTRTCVSLKEYIKADLTMCQFRCQTQEPWAYCLLDLRGCNIRTEPVVGWELCEIWLSNQ